jgi:hypothetical protein
MIFKSLSASLIGQIVAVPPLELKNFDRPLPSESSWSDFVPSQPAGTYLGLARSDALQYVQHDRHCLTKSSWPSRYSDLLCRKPTQQELTQPTASLVDIHSFFSRQEFSFRFYRTNGKKELWLERERSAHSFFRCCERARWLASRTAAVGRSPMMLTPDTSVPRDVTIRLIDDCSLFSVFCGHVIWVPVYQSQLSKTHATAFASSGMLVLVIRSYVVEKAFLSEEIPWVKTDLCPII